MKLRLSGLEVLGIKRGFGRFKGWGRVGFIRWYRKVRFSDLYGRVRLDLYDSVEKKENRGNFGDIRKIFFYFISFNFLLEEVKFIYMKL